VRPALTLVLATVLAGCTPPLAREDYPARPVTMIVGYGAGGSTDLAARIVAAHMERTLGQPIIIENRLGGNGTVGTRAVYTASPDGYTIGMTSGSILTVLPWTMDLGFDPLELTFVGSSHESTYAIWVHADSPWTTIEELLAYARSNPDQLLVANSSGFGLPDIAMAQLSRMSDGFTYRTVPTTGGAEQVLRLLAGDVDAEANSAAPTLSHFRAGRLRPLLVLSTAWPELEELGIPLSNDEYGFNARNLSAIVGPPGLDESIRQKLEAALEMAMNDTETLDRLSGTGELIEFKTGRQIRASAAAVQAEQFVIGQSLGRATR
jgi:tripartite-type tricarboxylate transporter receptor subunit TctC